MYIYVSHVYDMKVYRAYWEEGRRGNREGTEGHTVHVFLHAYDTKAEGDCVPGRRAPARVGRIDKCEDKSVEGQM